MNKKSKKTLIIVSVCILCLLIFYPFISSYISDLKTLKYKEYDKIGDEFVYDFQLNETYNYLEEIVTEYNKEFGYETENKILMGKGKKEVVFAEYDENGITIYCENTVNCKLTNNQIQEYLMWFLDSDLFYDYFDEMHIFVNDLINYHTGISVIMLPMIFETTKSDIFYGGTEVSNDVFIYEYKYEDTYEKIKDAVKVYCEKYDVAYTDNIIYGMEYEDSIPIVAEYNNKYIKIYITELTENQQIKQTNRILATIIKELKSTIKDKELLIQIIDEFSASNSIISSIMLPFIYSDVTACEGFNQT